MASIQFSEADRDDQGFVKAREPRSLADLLPPVATPADPTIRRQPLTRGEFATMILFAVLFFGLLAYLWSGQKLTSATTPRVTPVATFQPTAAPTVLPTAAPAALVGYFDYRDPASVAPITANQITRVIGTAGDSWRLVEVGNARVWIAAELLPTGIPAADPLPDLTPRRPVPAPAVQPVNAPVASPAPCTQDIAPYVVHRQVQSGTLPIGEVTGWSCASAAAAEVNASAHEAEVRASYAATTTTKTSEATP